MLKSPVHRRLRLCTLAIASIALLAGPGTVRADFTGIDLQKPEDRQFVVDKAELIGADDEKKIRELADKLMTEKKVPIVVVAIENMAKHGGSGLRIETFSRLLFDQWQVGPEKVGGEAWNYGILLVVSKGDRKARIELGAGWRREKDLIAQRIMAEQIIPHFKKGNFAAGIVAGVEALDRMARELPKPPATSAAIHKQKAGTSHPGTTDVQPHQPSSHSPSIPLNRGAPLQHFQGHSGGTSFISKIVVVLIFLAVVVGGFMVLRMILRLFTGGGSSGGSWGGGGGGMGGGGGGFGNTGSFLGGAATGILGSILYGMFNRSSGHGYGSNWDDGNHGHHSGFGGGSSHSDSGRSYSDSGSSSYDGGDSGGSFDSGFSGGGGATGEW